MPGTYSQILLHVVFSTKGRQPLISAEIAERLYPYIGGIVRAERGILIAIGGVEDHLHMYLRWRPDGSISDLMRTVKSRSSKWLHTTYPHLACFAWQEGYSAFSVSKSQENAVKAYITRQREHHQKEDFTSELMRLLDTHAIEVDQRYVFD
ncbi:MAG: IS200/IS605 family transposase [Hyphomicrobiaceae bacterium]|nr:IS200/IS605 family transposase [Hyphomicrobiaceae bacterium]